MTDPTPTPQAPPQGLTEDTLREQWNAQADEFNQWDSLDSAEQFSWAQKCAIAAHEAARVGLHCYLDDDGPCPSPCVFDDPAEQISNCTYAQGLQRDSKPKTACPYYRPTPTPEALQAAYAAWFKAEQGIPPSPAAARTAAAFASAVLRGEVAA